MNKNSRQCLHSIDDLIRNLRGEFSALVGINVHLESELEDARKELTKSVDVRTSERDGLIRDMVQELEWCGYDIPCDDDGRPIGWTRPVDSVKGVHRE